MASIPPNEDIGDAQLEIGSPKRKAAGLPGVVASLQHAYGQMGAVRAVRTLGRLNQKNGFDCPGCAWPEPNDRHVVEWCENGAKAVAEEATVRRITRAFFAEHPVDDLATRSGYWLGQQGRLTEPMVLRPGATHYEPISWDGALDLLAGSLRALPSPDRATFYTSGRTSNEAAFVYQLFVRAYGTNNLPDCSNMCHESSGAALAETLGVGKGSVTLDDIYAADLIMVLGQNPGTNHPRMLGALERAKHNGAKIIAINPLPEAGLINFMNPQRPAGMLGRGTTLADHFFQIRVNGDLALMQAVGQLLLEMEDAAPGSVVDRSFVERYTHGYDAYAAHLRRLSWPDVETATGLTRDEIELLAREIAGAKRLIACWAMGLTQHKNSVATIREVVNVLLLGGHIGRTGAGVCPVRGHSNVQGDRTMGIWEKPPASFLDALRDEFGFEPPREHGLDTVDTIRAIRDGRVDVLLALGGNFASATPDTGATEAALRTLRLSAHVSTKLNRSHVVTGETALIIPTLGRTERDVQASGPQSVSVEDSMSQVHLSRGRLAPAADDLRSEVAIVCELAERVLAGRGPRLPWAEFRADYRRIRERISRVVPGFADYERLLAAGGFRLPHPPRDERRFPTRTGLANFTANALDVVQVPPGRLLLQTVRSHDQYNTTIYGLDDRYRGIRGGRRVVFVHPDDLAELGVGDGAIVDLVGEDGSGGERRAPRFRTVGYPVARGCAAAYFPETNVLVPLDSTATTSNTPTSKSIIIRLEPAGAGTT